MDQNAQYLDVCDEIAVDVAIYDKLEFEIIVLLGTLVRTSPKRTLYVRALFDYDPHKVHTCCERIIFRET